MARAGRAKHPRGRIGREVRVPQQARSRRTRERILEAAAACFEDRGYDETTTAEIARRAGIAVGSIYDYFQDKRAILLEILHDTVEQVANGVVEGLAPEAWQGADPRDSVRKLLELVFRSRQVQPGMQRILWERFFRDPELRAAMERIEDHVRGAMTELLQAIRSDGRLRIDDVETAAFVIHLSVEWTASRLILGGAPVEMDATIDAATDMITRYLFPDF
jgi:AcrR family transcriptional regulator